jgi:hypothetical protein
MIDHTEHRSLLSVDIVNRTVFYNAASAIKQSYLMLLENPNLDYAAKSV